MSSDAFRRVAEALRNSSVALRTSDSTASTIQRHIAKALFDVAVASDKETPEPQPASPDVRAVLMTFIGFIDLYFFESDHVDKRWSDLGKRLATEARAALAKPVAQPDIVAELVAACEVVKHSVDRCKGSNRFPADVADEVLGILADVIAKAKGQSNG